MKFPVCLVSAGNLKNNRKRKNGATFIVSTEVSPTLFEEVKTAEQSPTEISWLVMNEQFVLYLNTY